MTQEEKTKAEEIASINCRFYGESHDSYLECKTSALEMAEWKDQQFQEEKKDLRNLVDMLPMNDSNQTIIEDLKALL